ncbi:MAG: metal-dependent hydrolase [Magnetococcales bacterium]|nr:metal-dependent hydrolase [Magnetococcales bacterium]
MAGFHVHIYVAASISGIAGTSVHIAGYASPGQMVLFSAAGLLGGILPDIDADHSTSYRVAFALFSFLIAFLVMFGVARGASLVEALLVWGAVALFLRYILYYLVMRLTAHRGILHSIPACGVFGLGAVALMHILFAVDAYGAWMCGIFVAGGAMVHLLLDELYSINLFAPGGVKRSFGSALKLFSSNLPATAGIYLALVILWVSVPDYGEAFPAGFGETLLRAVAQTALP